jgi:hypothetical protein
MGERNIGVKLELDSKRKSDLARSSMKVGESYKKSCTREHFPTNHPLEVPLYIRGFFPMVLTRYYGKVGHVARTRTTSDSRSFVLIIK